MAGKIKNMIEEIIEKRSNGNETIKNTTKTKLILKGIDPDVYDSSSEDLPDVVEKLKVIAQELGLAIN